jgi:hypothetical protein
MGRALLRALSGALVLATAACPGDRNESPASAVASEPSGAAPPATATAVTSTIISAPTASSADGELVMVAREEDYEIKLPKHWTKQQEPGGGWILVSTKGPESLRVRVVAPERGDVKDPEVAAKAAVKGLSDKMTTHEPLKSEWLGKTYSVVGTGTSVEHQALLAYRVLANDKKVVWALHEVSLGGRSPVKVDKLAADPKMDEHRLGMLATLTLR